MKAWTEVSFYGDPGTEFGIVENIEGKLAVTCRRPGEPWPHGLIPFATNTIQEGFKRYVVIGEDGELNDDLMLKMGFERRDNRLELMFNEEDGIFAESKGPTGYYFTSFVRYANGTEDTADIYPDPETELELASVIGTLKRKAGR